MIIQTATIVAWRYLSRSLRNFQTIFIVFNTVKEIWSPVITLVIISSCKILLQLFMVGQDHQSAAGHRRFAAVQRLN